MSDLIRHRPRYREMAADGFRIARRATSPIERAHYLQAAEYWNRRAIEFERTLKNLEKRKRVRTGRD